MTTNQALAAARTPSTLRIASLRALPGCSRGSRAPFAVARIVVGDGARWLDCIERAAIALEPHIPGCTAPLPEGRPPQARSERFEHEMPFVQRLLVMLRALTVEIGLPAIGELRAAPLSRDPEDDLSRWLLVLPSYAPQATAAALQWLVGWIVEAAEQGERPLSPERRAALDDLIRRLSRLAPPGNNVRHFVRTAYDRKIPWIVLPSGIIQYGWGCRGRLLDSTFTDETPNIAARLARDKTAANAMLRTAGIPVPEQKLVTRVEEAIAAATALGYPVVVKPARLDGGHGVSAGLEDELAVRTAFARAARHGRDVVIEKHVDGKDYRIIVFRGKPIWAIERIPAGVTGTGRHTLKALIAQTNRDPRRSTRPWAQMRPLCLDEESRELLEEQGLTLDSVPPANQFVRLRRRANISSGGTPLPVLERMHPENAALAVRAARVLRLDVAGVDLLTPDISRSWREVGGAICEVNAQPQLSITAPHLYGEIFDQLVAGQGRIPIAFVLSSGNAEELVRGCTEILERQGLRVGISTPAGLLVAGERVRRERLSAFGDVRALFIDPAVDVVIFVGDGREFLSTGLPFDRFDELVLDGDWSLQHGGPPASDLRPLVLNLLAQHCSNRLLVCRDHAERDGVVTAYKGGVETVSSSERLVLRLAQRILATHRSSRASR